SVRKTSRALLVGCEVGSQPRCPRARAARRDRRRVCFIDGLSAQGGESRHPAIALMCGLFVKGQAYPKLRRLARTLPRCPSRIFGRNAFDSERRQHFIIERDGSREVTSTDGQMTKH